MLSQRDWHFMLCMQCITSLRKHITEQSSNMSTTILPLDPLQVHASLGTGSLRGSNWMTCFFFLLYPVFTTLSLWSPVMKSVITLAFQSSPINFNTQEILTRNWTRFKGMLWTWKCLFLCFKMITTCCLLRVFVSFSQNNGALKNSVSLLRSRTLRENILFIALVFVCSFKLITKPQR